jgi:hypothetical protein
MDTIKKEMNNTLSQEKNALQEEHDKQIAALQQEKNNLLDQINEAKKNEEEAINNLSKLQDDQNSLIEKLGTINQVLAKQLETIDSISIDQPNINAYSDLLTDIEAGLKGVMGGINQAVSSTATQQVSNSTPETQTSLYDRFIKLTPTEQEQIYDKLDEKDIAYSQLIKQQLSNPNPSKQNIININNILKKRYVENLNGDNNLLRGGKQKRRTMKKRSKKTRKLRKKYQKGGYTYSASKELDKASSIVSNLSVSNSGTKSRTIRNKKKSRKRSRK